MTTMRQGNFIVPDTCAHGVAWAYPCATCGRGYPQPSPASAWTRADIDRLLNALERIADRLASEGPR